MGVKSNIAQVQLKVEEVFANMAEDLKLTGEAGAEAIVRTTLAGIAEDDQSFAPYSARYQQILDAVGGKMRGVVDMRGIFYHEGQERVKYKSEKRRQKAREGRQAYVGVAFASTTSGIHAFQAKTLMTRPQIGMTDPRSEMSLDLIKVSSTDDRITIEYTPRAEDYMVAHQNGTAPGGKKRVWFSARKTAVEQGMLSVLRRCLQARVSWFNTAGVTEPPPAPEGGDAGS